MPPRSSSRLPRLGAILALLTLPPACSTAPRAAGSKHVERAHDPVLALVRRLDLLAEADLWPGFDPRRIPLAIYDGERTILFRHSRPPQGFEPLEGGDAGHVYPGRHPAVTANTRILLDSVATAALVPDFGSRSPDAWAATLAHEAFHVFQAARHPEWQANEAELFTYPVDRAELVALRRQESVGLRRALASTRPDSAACWARYALEVRARRFAALPEGAVAYERGSEMNEGLATYVEHRAASAGREAGIPEEEFPAEAVRLRSYASGLSLALLLDRFAPRWRESLEAGDSRPLDRLLGESLPGHVPACALDAPELDRLRRTAEADVAALRERRAEQERQFQSRSGVRLVVELAQTPLFPEGFDPLNVQTIAEGRVLHTRFLKLGGPAGVVQVLDRAVLTEAAGAHPLFNGVRRLTVTGLAEPDVSRSGERLTIRAPGLELSLRGAALEREGATLVVRTGRAG